MLFRAVISPIFFATPASPPVSRAIAAVVASAADTPDAAMPRCRYAMALPMPPLMILLRYAI